MIERDLPAAELSRELARARVERRALVEGDGTPRAQHLGSLIFELRDLNDQAAELGPNRGRDVHRQALAWAIDELLDQHSDVIDEAQRAAERLTARRRRRPVAGH